jgi:hypothetical protein
LTIHEKRTLAADAPPGSRFKGDAGSLLRNLMIRPHVARFHRECWRTTDGKTAKAALPAGGDGNFGPELCRVGVNIGLPFEARRGWTKTLSLRRGCWRA